MGFEFRVSEKRHRRRRRSKQEKMSVIAALTLNNYKSTLTYCQTFQKPILVKGATFCSTEATRQLTVTCLYSYASKQSWHRTGKILFSYSSAKKINCLI